MVENLNRIHWDDQGLVPVIAQDYASSKVLMFAWMNREALQKTIETRTAVYFSRSRRRLWYKGEESGHVQHVKSLRMDCDQDVLLLGIEQVGDQAAFGWVFDWSGRSTCLPLVKGTPARTSATRWGAFTMRHRAWAASMSLNAIAMPAALEPGPLVTR